MYAHTYLHTKLQEGTSEPEQEENQGTAIWRMLKQTHANTLEIKLEAHTVFTHTGSNGTMPKSHIISYSTVKPHAGETECGYSPTDFTVCCCHELSFTNVRAMEFRFELIFMSLITFLSTLLLYTVLEVLAY